jgi:DNA recombination protein RmuC
MTVAFALLVGLLAGALVAFVALVRPALAARDRRAAEVAALQRELAAAEARLQASEESLGDRVRDAVRAASADAYRQANTAFLELAGTKLEGTVAPLRESLTKVNDQVAALDRARAQSYGALRQQVEVLSERAGSLANALRSSDVRGRWGEAQLRNVVERAGLLEHCDFVAQVSARDGEGDLLRPDLVVRVPGGKSVVVDAKVPLAAYLDAFETQDESARGELLARHARQVRDHVTKLAGKAYQRQFTPAPDFVVMFVPDETLLRAAHEHDTRLSEDAWARGVILASPSTLMTLMRTVAAIWQQETVAESARAIHALGTELHKRLGTFSGHLAKAGRALDSAVGSYNEAVGSFESRVLVQARKLEQHGVGGELASPRQVERQARTVAAEPEAEPHAADRSVVELPRDAHAA